MRQVQKSTMGERGMMRTRRGTLGFTFIEVLIAITLLVMGFLGLFASIHSSAQLRESSHETSIAMFKLQRTNEFLFGLPFDDITTTLPADTVIDIAALTDSDVNNDDPLNGEQITISYEDPAADPLKFTISIAWTTRFGNARQANISSGRVR